MKWLSVVAAVVLVVLVMHPGGGSTLDISPLVSCTPDCSGVANGGKVPDPFNCTNYYYCMSGLPTDHPNSCGDSSIFNPATSECEAGTDCTPICGSGWDVCPLSCNGTLDVIAEPTDCSVYYFCTPSGPVPAACPPEKPHFNGVDCVNDESVCCSGYCGPYCDGSGTVSIIPDPVDCTMYYICETDTAEGPPDEDKHFRCPSGQIFDVKVLECVPGDASTCVTLCDAAGGGGGGGRGRNTRYGGQSRSSSGCVLSLTCPGAGYYAACDTCDPKYFDCEYAGAAGVLMTCPSGSVFNPNPEHPFCVLETNCPYP